MLTYLQYLDEYKVYIVKLLRNVVAVTFHEVSEIMLLDLTNVTDCRNTPLHILFNNHSEEREYSRLKLLS